MDSYINHLISDIEKLLKQKPEKPTEIWDIETLKNDDEDEGMSFMDQSLYGKKMELQHIVGIQKEALPPQNRLTDNQISILFPYLEALLEHHHFELSYPCKLDKRTKYELLYNKWDIEHTNLNYGIVGIEFCDYDETNCPIPGKCKYCEESRLEYAQSTINESINGFDPIDLILATEQIETNTKQQKVEKVKTTLENLKPDEGNIPGIFNYCNRWCEKCLFTDKCTNYQFEKELGFYDKNVDKDKMLENVGAILSGTLSLLKSKMDELDIDLSQFDNDEEMELIHAKDHPLSILARNYMKNVSDWLEENFIYFSDVASNVFNKSQKNFKLFNNHLETIGWHMTMIPVKIVRALNPNLSNDDDEFYEFDRNATGKLVFECIDESISSLSLLYEKLSKKRDEILDFLALLSQLKAGLEKEMPEAKSFIRPGLDE